jgi:RHS repeat-associated protein
LNSQIYTYDAVGNRTSYSTNIAQSLTTDSKSSQYGPSNRLLQSASPNDSTIYFYDDNGNLVSITNHAGTTAFRWDSRNHLRGIATATGEQITFVYDFAGNLISQQNSGQAGIFAREFVLDDLTNIAYLRRSDGDNLSMLRGNSIDEHLAAVHSNGQIEYGLTDSINSTVASSNQTGDLVSSLLYEPFGQTSSVGTYPFQYTGRVAVADNLYYYRARYYDSDIGRFLSEDPIGFAGGVNLYEYVGSQPTGRLDPLGQDWLNTSANLAAGFGDNLTFGGTAWIRQQMGTDGQVDRGSVSYNLGQAAGLAWWTAAGGIGAAGSNITREAALITVTDAKYAQMGLAGLSDAEKLAELGGVPGALGTAAGNAFNPEWWATVARTTLETGPTAGGQGGLGGAAAGALSWMWNLLRGSCSSIP